MSTHKRLLTTEKKETMSRHISKNTLCEFLTDLEVVLNKYDLRLKGDAEIIENSYGTYIGIIEDEYSTLSIITEDGDVVASIDKDS